jgi:hypothetical protein
MIRACLILAISAAPVAAQERYLISAIFCEAEECVPVRVVLSPRGSETGDFCARYAFGRAVTLAHSFIARVSLTVQPGSVFCEEI